MCGIAGGVVQRALYLGTKPGPRILLNSYSRQRKPCGFLFFVTT
jgi:hypothetical protein